MKRTWIITDNGAEFDRLCEAKWHLQDLPKKEQEAMNGEQIYCLENEEITRVCDIVYYRGKLRFSKTRSN